MRTKLTLVIFALLIIVAACHTSKKTTTSTAEVSKTTAPTNTVVPVVLAPKSLDGIYPPGNEELVAIQLQDKDVTLEKLNMGHILYTQSACIACHKTQSIYKYNVQKWGYIISDMAYRAGLTPTQKDAVLKYVLAIKATQSN